MPRKKKVVTRARKFATPRGPKKVAQTRTSAKNVVVQKFDELAETMNALRAYLSAPVQSGAPVPSNPELVTLMAQVQGLMATQQVVISALKSVLEIHKAGFIDAWKQYCLNLRNQDQEPKASEFLKAFDQTGTVLGLGIEHLDALDTDREVPEAAPVEPEAPQAPAHVNGTLALL